MFRTSLKLTVLLLVALAGQDAALADEWMPAQVKTYYSQDHRVRFTVIPRGVSSPLAFFEDKVRNKPQAGQAPGGAPSAQGVLEQEGRDGRWATVWRKQLVNDVSPVSALVANSARYVVTFDNWHAMGWGNDAVVIYGEDGKLVRSFALTALLPDYYFQALPHTVSSIWWSGEHRLAEKDGLLILSVVVPTDDAQAAGHDTYVQLSVRLANGEVLPASGADWDKARAAARTVASLRQKETDDWNSWFRNPLVAPKTDVWTDWLPYLHEIFERLDPGWRAADAGDGHDPSEIILPSAGSKGWFDTPEDLRLVFLKWTKPHVILIGSPGGIDRLVKVLTPILAEAKPDAFKRWRIYVVCTPDDCARVAQLFAQTGATLIPVDPTVGISQRPERLKEQGLAP